MSAAIAYYRVSTKRQGTSGLGLEAQEAAVRGYCLRQGLELLESYTEVESGKRDDRPQLAAALAHAKRAKAQLIIAKLDRLARSVAFISSLMESGVEFIACDMPTANRLTIHILAAVAEHEREMIGARTRAALAEARRRGTRLGNPKLHLVRAQGTQATQERAREHARLVLPHLFALEREGCTTQHAQARALERLGVPTARGGRWTRQAVASVRRHAQQWRTQS